jgi:hypothetical protein
MSISNASPDVINKTKVTQYTGALTAQVISVPDASRRFLRIANRTNQAVYLQCVDINGTLQEIALISATYGEYVFPFSFQGTLKAAWTTQPTTGKLLVVEFYE